VESFHAVLSGGERSQVERFPQGANVTKSMRSEIGAAARPAASGFLFFLDCFDLFYIEAGIFFLTLEYPANLP